MSWPLLTLTLLLLFFFLPIHPGKDTATVPHTFTLNLSAISRYGDYLEGVYSRSSVSSDGKFPPTPSKTYVNLALVKRTSEIRDLEDVRKNLIHGRVDEMLEGKQKIETNDILKPQDNGNPVSLVFVEGPPGVGKSTLAWELCRRWDRKQYDLTVLLRLRERKVQQINGVCNLFPHEDQDLQKAVANEVLKEEGRGVLFILDGFDELPVDLRSEGFLFRMLQGTVLPKCCVLVTSRPSATEDLNMTCTQIQRHIEILGFTQECIKGYASSILSDEPELLKDFLLYISPSVNPVINSLMYIPLNAVIIVHIYKNSKKSSRPIPKTLTQVYTQLCLTLLQRYTWSVSPQKKKIITKISDLPDSYYKDFSKLAQLAFEQFQKHNVVFYSSDLPKDLVHFGFLDSVSALCGGGGISYNFLHLTLQEFLAAYHITQLSNGIDVFKRHSEDRRWELVWRFVSGLTGFQYFKDSVRCDAFCASRNDEYLEVKHLLLHCLFESQLMFDYMAVLGTNKMCSDQEDLPLFSSSPLDRYALGYCIANCSSATSWKVCILHGSDESFMWGLNSNHCGNGVISSLKLNVLSTCLDSYPSNILSDIDFFNANIHGMNLLVVLPQMKKLTSLNLHAITPAILGVITQSNVTTLRLHSTIEQTSLFSIHGLINSPSKKLKDLTIISNFSHGSTRPLCDVLFGPSSLTSLTLRLPKAMENSFDLLKSNTCLTTVDILCTDIHHTLSLQPLSSILQNNKTIEKLRWGYCDTIHFYPAELESLNDALFYNTTLKELILNTNIGDYSYLSSLIHDIRVKCI